MIMILYHVKQSMMFLHYLLAIHSNRPILIIKVELEISNEHYYLKLF